MSLSMKRLTFILFSLFMAIFLHGQQAKVLLSIDRKDITEDEFQWMYNKNNSSVEVISPEAYLKSYVVFQLKIRDAEKMGLDTTPAFRKDVNEFKDQLITSYIPQEPNLDMLVKEAYERMKSDVNASHILIRVAPNASDADTLKAFNEIFELRERIINGEDFNEVAMEYSEDPASRVNGGNLNYFTALTMLYPIETAAYETLPGTISKPVRSSMGYHILKVNERRPAAGRFRVAHIFTGTLDQKGEPKTEKEQEEARLKIYAAFDSLHAGMPFTQVVQAFSEDPGATQTGGELPVFGVGQMVPEFERQVFNLGGPGSISRPFKTIFGWHIIQLLEIEPIGSFKQNKEDLQRRVISDKRPEYHHYLHLERVKRTYGFSAYPEELEMVFSEGDSSLLKGEWLAGELAANQNTLLTIGSSDLSIGDFAEFIEVTQSSDSRARIPRLYMTQMYHQFIDNSLLEYEYNRMPEEHSEISHLLQEYRDGILLFEISNRKVWAKALSDTAGLSSFFQNHREQYMWEERYDAFIITCKPGADVEKVRKKHKKIQSGKLDAQLLNDKYCDNDTVACVHVSRVLTEKGVYNRIDRLDGMIGPGPIYYNKFTKGFVIINQVLSPEPKKLAEAKGEVVSDYQKYLEEEWIEEIRQKYSVTIYGVQ